MKKSFVLVVLALFTFLLVSCDSTTTPDEEVVLEYDATWVEEEIELTYAAWGYPTLEAEVLDAFMDKYPNVTVTRDAELNDSNGWETNLIERAAAGTLPDVYTGRQIDHVYLNDLALDLRAFVDRDPEIDDVNPNAMELVTIGEKVYGLPSFGIPKSILVNKNLLQEFNLDIPEYTWTVEDFEYIVDNVFSLTPGDCAFAARNYMDLLPSYAAIKNDGDMGWYTFDGDQFNFTHPDHLDIMEREKERSDRLLLFLDEEQTNTTCGVTDGHSWGRNGRQALNDLYLWDYGWWSRQYAENVGDGNSEIFFEHFDVYPFPTVEGKDPTTPLEVNFINISPLITDAKKASAAYELAKWMGFGKDGMLERYQIISDWESYDSESEFFGFWRMPISRNQEIWDVLPYADYDLPGLTSETFISAVFNGLINSNRRVPGQGDGINTGYFPYVSAYRAGDFSGSLLDLMRESESVANEIVADAKARVGWED